MPKTIVLHIIALYICFLTFLKPADAVLERGIAYVDNYDPASNKENEWHKRAHGGPYKSDEANSDWLKREANEDGGDVNETPEESHDWLMKRSGTVTFQAAQPFPPSGKSLKMNKRGLIEEWLHPHAMEKRQGCQDAGWVPCSNNRGCCPTSSACCATGCKNNPTDVCCPGYNCKAGYQCDGLCGGCVVAGGGCCPDGVHTCGAGQSCCSDGCVTTGSKCCSDGGSCRAGYQCCEDGCAVEGSQCCLSGGSCEKGNICVIYEGKQGCCTDLSCTAWISDGVRIPLTPTATEEPTPIQTAPPTTAPPDTNTQVVEIYYTYRFTITWWYWWYYYTYYAVLDVSTVTSSQSTITTIVSITDTASEAASSQFEAVSSSIVAELTTPAEATTALATPTLPANTAGTAETDTATGLQLTYTSEGITLTIPEPPGSETPVPLPTSSRRTNRTTSTATGPIAGGPDDLATTGGGAVMVEVNWWLGWVMGGVAMGAGMGMLWL